MSMRTQAPWYRRMQTLWREGPYLLARRPIPEPGSENLINTVLAIPFVSAINGAIPNHRTFATSEPLVVPNHLVGLTGPGGYQVTYPYYAAPLIQIQPGAGPEVITFFG
jgi:hypothetical protein